MRALIFFVLLLATTARAEMWLEIRPGLGRNSVEVRLMDSEFRAPLYWLERSEDGGKTWSEAMPLENGLWRHVVSIKPQSTFRGKLMSVDAQDKPN
jgi:hypothetical protein